MQFKNSVLYPVWWLFQQKRSGNAELGQSGVRALVTKGDSQAGSTKGQVTLYVKPEGFLLLTLQSGAKT